MEPQTANDEHEDSCDDWTASSDDDELFDFFSGGTEQSAMNEIDPSLAVAGTDHNAFHWPWPPLLDVHDIRVFKMDLDSSFSDAIRCHFEVVSLSTPTSYLALSYAWGETKYDESHLTHTIYCDGVPMRVTENLFEALRHIRHVWQTDAGVTDGLFVSAVWVDAICIDQANPIERGRQVMVMDKIYSHASYLLIWLGVSSVFDAPKRHPKKSTSSDLSRLPWFGRRWVIEEAMSCTQDHFLLAGSQYEIVKNIVEVLIDETRLLRMWRRFDQYNPPRTHLMDTLVKFGRHDCSDDRDRIYALRNISVD